MAEWLLWWPGICGRIGVIGSTPSNGLRLNLCFNPLCTCVYINVRIVKPDIQTIYRYIIIVIHICIHMYKHTHTLDYGCIVYRSAVKSYLQMLDRVHNQGLRLCLGAFRTSPVKSLYVDAHEPCLGARRAKLCL